jgi:Domain of Unknown Function (DUF928)
MAVCKLVTIGVTCLSLLGAFAPLSISFNNSNALLPLTIGNGSAFADDTQPYVPPGGRDLPQRTQGSGARGCTNSIPVTLNLLAPGDHIARTTLAHPTFLWNVSQATSVPMIFTLTAPGSQEAIFQKQLKADKAGIVQLELPQTSNPLTVGQQYRWTVALVCNQKRPSQNINARAWIERVANTPELTQKLATAKNQRDRALIYTKSGVWYDGIAILNQLQATNPQNQQSRETFVSLLKQVGLNKLISSAQTN